MSQEIYEVDDVYGITRELPHNYVGKKSVDEKLQNDLDRGKHIVIYGSSKQGKTCLRKHCIHQDNQIVVQCNNKWGLKDIHTAILKRAGYEITLSEKKTVSGTQKIKAKLSAKLLDVGGEVGVKEEKKYIYRNRNNRIRIKPRRCK